MDISIQQIDSVSILIIGKEQIPIKDYKISSSMQSGTELEVVIKLDGSVMEFSTSTSQKSQPKQSLTTKNVGSSHC